MDKCCGLWSTIRIRKTPQSQHQENTRIHESQKATRFFDITERTAKLAQLEDPLVGLSAQINWEAFRADLNRVHEKARKSNAGAKPIDVVLMFKLLVLQQLHNLSDDLLSYAES